MDCDNDSQNLWGKQTEEGKNYTKKYSSKYSWRESEMEIMSTVNNFWWQTFYCPLNEMAKHAERQKKVTFCSIRNLDCLKSEKA